jgi:site-specific DNA-methyltransferase (adenine-specific)
LEPGLTTFVRYNEALSILRKVRDVGEETFDHRVQSRNPYGIPADFADFSTTASKKTPVLLFRSRRGSTADKKVYVAANAIKANADFMNRIKVLVSKASPGGDEYPHAIFSTPIVAPRNSVSTETYLIVDFPVSVEQAENLLAYMRTRFFRFLVSLIKTTQNISKSSFAMVPVQDLSVAWTDEMLFEKYRLTKKEIAFIESMIRPMGENANDE